MLFLKDMISESQFQKQMSASLEEIPNHHFTPIQPFKQFSHILYDHLLGGQIKTQYLKGFSINMKNVFCNVLFQALPSETDYGKS